MLYVGFGVAVNSEMRSSVWALICRSISMLLFIASVIIDICDAMPAGRYLLTNMTNYTGRQAKKRASRRTLHDVARIKHGRNSTFARFETNQNVAVKIGLASDW